MASDQLNTQATSSRQHEDIRKKEQERSGKMEMKFQFAYSVFLFFRRVIYKLLSEAGCGEVTNPK